MVKIYQKLTSLTKTYNKWSKLVNLKYFHKKAKKEYSYIVLVLNNLATRIFALSLYLNSFKTLFFMVLFLIERVAQ